MVRTAGLLLLLAVAVMGNGSAWQCDCQQPGDAQTSCGFGCTTATSTELMMRFHPQPGNWDPNDDFETDWAVNGNTLTAMNNKWVCSVQNAASSCPAPTIQDGLPQSCSLSNGQRCPIVCASGTTPHKCETGPFCLGGTWTPFSCVPIGPIASAVVSTPTVWSWTGTGMYTSMVGGDERYIGSMRWGPFCLCKSLKVNVAGGGANAADAKIIRIKKMHDDSTLLSATFQDLLGGQDVDPASPMQLTIDTTPFSGKEAYLEFEDSDANAHGNGNAWMSFDPNFVISC
eukprot:NODE_2669_length_1013_cov_192.318284_g2649_i0.p2 GENE.NODE_2669_length_1013_cov_192.318284_g2649_i0~~NODE_2669_length_1013_cov_192.318284_g2649_i0.p2  ORF type:complete len:286 (-),score=49.15 NODE_2669_length_1013_cov_192.318284_g2649_i0:92-949(-)